LLGITAEKFRDCRCDILWIDEMDVMSSFNVCVLESSFADIPVYLDKIFDDRLIFID
jgi:hypothetical protein